MDSVAVRSLVREASGAPLRLSLFGSLSIVVPSLLGCPRVGSARTLCSARSSSAASDRTLRARGRGGEDTARARTHARQRETKDTQAAKRRRPAAQRRMEKACQRVSTSGHPSVITVRTTHSFPNSTYSALCPFYDRTVNSSCLSRFLFWHGGAVQIAARCAPPAPPRSSHGGRRPAHSASLGVPSPPL